MAKEKRPKKSSVVEETLAKLKPKQRRYVKAVAHGATKVDAARLAGYSESVALSATANIEGSANVQEAFRLLIRSEIDPAHIVKRIKEGLDAEKTEFAKFEGEISDERNCVDFEQRRKYAELASQLGEWWTPKAETKHTGGLSLTVVHEVIR